ncbi:MAG: bifunctional adenosylcobinamide kinase/adenosylcobinamide-phosphate guanylyltransferase [Lachnospiraceae bacterium]|nr:bifunctional adenosylcobinamide kinase/adenosylcobinamide-phosphate guanylyltransferase [Lachnospiraceae bacterium]
MIFITGGVKQGKREFAKMYFPDNLVMAAFHISIEQCLKDGKDPMEHTKAMLQMNPDVIIIMSEMGCGVTPTDPFARRLRDEVGRIGCYLANEATEVYRVIAGIGTRIK